MVETLSEFTFDVIGYWSEVKLEIIKKYAAAYSKIMNGKGFFHHAYIDGFCGAGEHLSKTDNSVSIPGSPCNALSIEPPFKSYHFIDLNTGKLNYLKQKYKDREDASFYNGDCNEILLNVVFPQIRFDRYERALCLLDPYGLQLSWEVVKAAGKSKAMEIFLNFPVADMNRNVFWNKPEGVSEHNKKRMSFFWGDDSWKDAGYKEVPTLFEIEIEKQDPIKVMKAFQNRLRTVAEFSYVPDPIPMKNSKGAIVYYLFFASQNNTGAKIVSEIFSKYRNR